MGMHAPNNFSQEANRLYTELTTDTLSLTRFGSANRAALAQALADAHNTARRAGAGQGQTNAAFLGISVSAQAIQHAMTYTQGYSGPDGWRHWQGRHIGTWWNDTTAFVDNASWHAPRTIAGGYDFQKVVFGDPTRPTRFGWNQSKAGVQYVWGWDPKDGTAGYQIHAGVTFEPEPGYHAIIWITPAEAFLEIVQKNDGGTGKRTSAGILGCGQWMVQ